jgi:hypothetical protein
MFTVEQYYLYWNAMLTGAVSQDEWLTYSMLYVHHNYPQYSLITLLSVTPE